MRRWEAGLSLHAASPVHGRPVTEWINLFVLTHEERHDGWQRVEWPDGGPALMQSWPQTVLLRAVADELAAVAHQRARRRESR